MLLNKKNACVYYWRYLLMILIEKILMKKSLTKKPVMKKIKYRMCLFKTFRVILSYSYIHDLIFKACKENNKIFFTIFFLYIKMTNNYYQKCKERLKKSMRKISKSFWRRKRKKMKKVSRKISKFNWRRKRKKASESWWT